MAHFLLPLAAAVLKFFCREVAVRYASLVCLFFLVVGLAAAPRSAARSKETGFLDRSVSVHGQTYRYQVFVPATWSAKQNWPIILFLHGAGERGSDGLLETDVGLPHAIRQDRSRFPAVVVMPQCLRDGWWPTREMEEMALGALSAATKEFNGDRKRTYLTGLSMGGFGTWDLAWRYPGKFAAVVPICGGLSAPPSQLKMHPELEKNSYPDEPRSYAEVAKKIGKTPVWIFHGDADEAVPVANSRKMYEALEAAGGDVRYTEYPGVGHNSWDKAYADRELTTWLFSKSL
jgi:predicted peptidase